MNRPAQSETHRGYLAQTRISPLRYPPTRPAHPWAASGAETAAQEEFLHRAGIARTTDLATPCDSRRVVARRRSRTSSNRGAEKPHRTPRAAQARVARKPKHARGVRHVLTLHRPNVGPPSTNTRPLGPGRPTATGKSPPLYRQKEDAARLAASYHADRKNGRPALAHQYENRHPSQARLTTRSTATGLTEYVVPRRTRPRLAAEKGYDRPEHVRAGETARHPPSNRRAWGPKPPTSNATEETHPGPALLRPALNPNTGCCTVERSTGAPISDIHAAARRPGILCSVLSPDRGEDDLGRGLATTRPRGRP